MVMLHDDEGPLPSAILFTDIIYVSATLPRFAANIRIT